MKIKFCAGDISSDGHSIREEKIFEVNLSQAELKLAFFTGIEKLGLLDYTEKDSRDDRRFTFCSNYEDSQVPTEFVEKLPFDPEEYFYLDDFDDEKVYYLEGADKFFELWLDIAKLGNPMLTYSEVVSDDGSIHIGGYGLFST